MPQGAVQGDQRGRERGLPGPLRVGGLLQRGGAIHIYLFIYLFIYIYIYIYVFVCICLHTYVHRHIIQILCVIIIIIIICLRYYCLLPRGLRERAPGARGGRQDALGEVQLVREEGGGGGEEAEERERLISRGGQRVQLTSFHSAKQVRQHVISALRASTCSTSAAPCEHSRAWIGEFGAFRVNSLRARCAVETEHAARPASYSPSSTLGSSGMWGLIANSLLTLKNSRCGDFTPKVDMGEGLSTSILKTHIVNTLHA